MKKPPKNKEEKSISNDDISKIMKPFVKKFGREIIHIQQLAKQHGIFLDDRALLSCQKCNLEEDVSFHGKLFVYNKSDAEFKDTGLQFQPIDNKNQRFKCPGCGFEVIVTNNEDEEGEQE